MNFEKKNCISTYVFVFNLLIKIHSFMKIHHVNRAYFAQQIVRSIRFGERIYTLLLEEEPVNYKISDMYILIFIEE